MPGPPPPAAVALFAAALPRAEHYARLLAQQGVDWGLLGPRERDRLWDRHLVNCAALAALIPPGSSCLDVGSGAGLPGIPLRLARPDLVMTLLEPRRRPVDFLELCVRELDLPDVRVERGRAEDVEGRLSAAVVLARAVAPLDRLCASAWPLVRPGGELLAVKGATAEAELTRCADALPADAASFPQVVRRTGPDGAVLVTVIRIRRRGRRRAVG